MSELTPPMLVDADGDLAIRGDVEFHRLGEVCAGLWAPRRHKGVNRFQRLSTATGRRKEPKKLLSVSALQLTLRYRCHGPQRCLVIPCNVTQSRTHLFMVLVGTHARRTLVRPPRSGRTLAQRVRRPRLTYCQP